MISGMTGFGASSFSYKDKNYTIHIRSVNHKFLDYVINLPEGLLNLNLEDKIKKELSKDLSRGRVTFQLSCPSCVGKQPFLNKKLLFSYYDLIKEINRSLKIKQEVFLRDIISLPEVICFKNTNEYADAKFTYLFNKSFSAALKKMLSSRKKEGKTIYLDLLKRIQRITQRLKLVKAGLSKIIKEQKNKLNSEEFEVFLKNYNIEEEIVRLEFHVKTFKDTIRQNGSLGKMLDFITQEMQREINTLSAKLRDSQISYSSVVIKDEVEKIREQLQNVE